MNKKQSPSFSPNEAATPNVGQNNVTEDPWYRGNKKGPVGQDDYFFERSPRRSLMRLLFNRETEQRSQRFGMSRGDFIKSSMGAMTAMSIIGQAGCFDSDAEAIDGFVPPNEDTYMASYTSLDGMSDLDWQNIESAVRRQQPGVVSTILNMIEATRDVYIGFGVDQFTHVTQTATRARRAGASDEMVLLSVLHDLGKVISNLSHPDIIAGIVRPYVSDNAYYILRHHMEFQWKHYGFYVFRPTNGRNRYVGQPWYDDAVRFSDKYDQRSFSKWYRTDPIEEFIPLIEQYFGNPEPRRYRTYQICR